MGEVTGFKKYARSTPKPVPAKERLQHFQEFYEPVASDPPKQQAARCMDCGIPFCHSGCPLGNLIPEFNDAVYKSDWKSAYNILKSTNNFPEFTGRICPAPCEASCVLGINKDAVAIEYIEKSIIERAFDEGWVEPKISENPKAQKIAIIGSGPAGLACADQLSSVGYKVTVYERANKIGGLLRYGIPDFKLEKYTIDRRLAIMEAQGVTFKTNTNVGTDISASELQSQYDAIVLCGGATVARDLPIAGRHLKGIHLAMEYLEQNNKLVDKQAVPSSEIIKVEGKNVVVLGGGDTGSDCIGTSNRRKAKSVTQIELLSQPPASRSADNPWPTWPQIMRTTSSHEEGCNRDWSVLTKRFLSDDGVNLSGVEIIKIDWQKDSTGKYTMTEITGSEQILPCEKAFLAIGFLHGEQSGMLGQLGVDLDNRGNVKTENYSTSKPAVFAAGDMRRGQSLVVWAISEGRECARAVDQYLEGSTSALSSKSLCEYAL